MKKNKKQFGFILTFKDKAQYSVVDFGLMLSTGTSKEWYQMMKNAGAYTGWEGYRLDAEDELIRADSYEEIEWTLRNKHNEHMSDNCLNKDEGHEFCWDNLCICKCHEKK